MLLVMACSQYTCSGHCTTADLRIRLRAYCLLVVSCVPGLIRLKGTIE